MGTRYLRYWKWIMIIVPVGVVLYFLSIRILPLRLAPGTLVREFPNKCWVDGKFKGNSPVVYPSLAEAKRACHEHCLGARMPRATHWTVLSNGGKHECESWSNATKPVSTAEYNRIRKRNIICVFSSECPQKKP